MKQFNYGLTRMQLSSNMPLTNPISGPSDIQKVAKLHKAVSIPKRLDMSDIGKRVDADIAADDKGDKTVQSGSVIPDDAVLQQDVPENVPDSIPDNIPEDFSDGISDDIPEDLSDDIPDGVVSDLDAGSVPDDSLSEDIPSDDMGGSFDIEENDDHHSDIPPAGVPLEPVQEVLQESETGSSLSSSSDILDRNNEGVAEFRDNFNSDDNAVEMRPDAVFDEPPVSAGGFSSDGQPSVSHIPDAAADVVNQDAKRYVDDKADGSGSLSDDFKSSVANPVRDAHLEEKSVGSGNSGGYYIPPVHNISVVPDDQMEYSNLKYVSKALVQRASDLFPDAPNKSVAVNAYLYYHEGAPANVPVTEDIKKALASYRGDGNRMTTEDSYNKLSKNLSHLKSELQHITDKVGSLEILSCFLLADRMGFLDKGSSTIAAVSELDFQDRAVEDVMTELSKQAGLIQDRERKRNNRR